VRRGPAGRRRIAAGGPVLRSRRLAAGARRVPFRGRCAALRRQGHRGKGSVSRFWKEIFGQESRTTAAGNPIMEKGSP
jgi:hypothetical protein